MAKKKNNHKAAPVSAQAPKAHKNSGASGILKKNFPWALTADCVLMLVFLLMNNWTFSLDVQLYFVIGAAAVFLATMMGQGNWKLLFSKISTILVVLLAQCLLYFISLFYATYAKFALQQFLLNIGALFVFATAYISVLRREINTEKLVSLFSITVVIASLMSIELATSGYLRGFFSKVADLLKAQMPADYGSFETNTRITTVLGTPNVFAPIAVMAMFLSLWSSGRTDRRSRRGLLQMMLALISGTTFILCFSLGTILAYIAMLFVYILVTVTEDRGAQLFRHIYSIVVSLIVAAIVYAIKDFSILPLCAVIGLCLLASFAYTWIKPVKLPHGSVPGSTTPEKKFTYRWAMISGIVVVCVGALILAMTLRGDYSMTAGASFRRAVALKPGTYTLQVNMDGQNAAGAAATVDISSMSYPEAALKTKTPLVTQQVTSGQMMQFTVPEASAAVFVSITANTDLVATDAAITGGGTTVELSLKYKLLPEFMVNRLQGLWVNDNAIQRFVFFRDGIRLGMKSPVFGLGGGAFEGGLNSVTDYYYTTKHVHNEFIQRFIDGGILGLLLFAALPIAVFRTLGKSRNAEKLRQIYPLLFACMAMIFLHALIEVDFLMIGYRIGASLLFALVAALCGDELSADRRARASVRAVFAGTFAVTVILALGHYFGYKTIDWSPNLSSVETAISMDPFNSIDYKLSYLASTTTSDDPQIAQTRQKYLKSMENKIPGADFLAQYYLTYTSDALKGTEKAELYIRQARVDPKAWNSIFNLYLGVLSTVDPASDTALIIKASIRNLNAYLEELNKTLPLKITPDQALYSSVLEAAGK